MPLKKENVFLGIKLFLFYNIILTFRKTSLLTKNDKKRGNTYEILRCSTNTFLFRTTHKAHIYTNFNGSL